MTHKHAEFIKAWLDGETVEVCTQGKWYNVGSLEVFVNFRNNEFRKKPTQWYRVGLFKVSGEWVASIANHAESELHFECQEYFVRWLTDRVYYEV